MWKKNIIMWKKDSINFHFKCIYLPLTFPNKLIQYNSPGFMSGEEKIIRHCFWPWASIFTMKEIYNCISKKLSWKCSSVSNSNGKVFVNLVVIKAHFGHHSHSFKPESFKIISTKHVKDSLSSWNAKGILESRVCINRGDAWTENLIWDASDLTWFYLCWVWTGMSFHCLYHLITICHFLSAVIPTTLED